MQINDNIKLIRELKGWTQLRIAPYFGVKVTTWKSYENTDIRPKAKLLAGLAKFAGLNMEDLDKPLKPDDIKFEDRKDRKGSQEAESAPLRPLHAGTRQITLDDYIGQIEATNEYLKAMLALSLNDISKGQKDIHSHLAGSIRREAERFAHGNQKAVQNEIDMISKYAAEFLETSVPKGSHAGKDKGL